MPQRIFMAEQLARIKSGPTAVSSTTIWQVIVLTVHRSISGICYAAAVASNSDVAELFVSQAPRS
jgi:hypothetical protein